jgi:hypothetical protein
MEHNAVFLENVAWMIRSWMALHTFSWKLGSYFTVNELHCWPGQQRILFDLPIEVALFIVCLRRQLFFYIYSAWFVYMMKINPYEDNLL